jgi:succinyl-CoA:acetate CoA-transferase
MTDRIACPTLRSRITDADSAAALIRPGETVATSGFTGSGYPKAVPQALARRMAAEHAEGGPSASTCGPAPRPGPNWTARWRRSTASRSACPIAAIRSRAED